MEFQFNSVAGFQHMRYINIAPICALQNSTLPYSKKNCCSLLDSLLLWLVFTSSFLREVNRIQLKNAQERLRMCSLYWDIVIARKWHPTCGGRCCPVNTLWSTSMLRAVGRYSSRPAPLIPFCGKCHNLFQWERLRNRLVEVPPILYFAGHHFTNFRAKCSP